MIKKKSPLVNFWNTGTASGKAIGMRSWLVFTGIFQKSPF